MKFFSRLFVMLFIFGAVVAPVDHAQNEASPQKSPGKPATPEAQAQQKNIQAYIILLRSDVRPQKDEIMGSIMALSAADAARFWPIYNAYDAELTKLNDQRVENIKDYAREYTQITDTKADELVQKSFTYQKQRAELFASTYDKVKQACGAVTAARFAQIEHQLLLLVDLQIASSLPIVGAE
jgi:hypothetical protein